MRERRIITVEGVVQGVGFRPFVVRTAHGLGLHGAVRNGVSGAEIDVEGSVSALDQFVRSIREDPPGPARVDAVTSRPATPTGRLGLSIGSSSMEGPRSSFSLVGPDLGTCPHCLAETFEPDDRRYRYPFHACTECGPRFSITRELPYDRIRTSMADFDPCPDCSREYSEPSDRRFHAQPIACPECGPRLRYRSARTAGEEARLAASVPLEPLAASVAAILKGEIVAIKGVGGYHLACDAGRFDVVGRLRERKARDGKPFAVMVGDLARAEALAVLREEEKLLLSSPARPIVLCRRRAAVPIADNVAPNLGVLGLMLPYTPLHHLLLDGVDRPLVMTSANLSGSPIVYDDEEADRLLAPVADAFLEHDRTIVVRSDDSVTRWLAGGPQILRRSRGYAPSPLRLTGHSFGRPTLAMGGHLKNTFCLGRGELAMLSPHIGDLEGPEGGDAFQAMLEHHLDLFDFRPEVVAHDLHPGYRTTRLAEEWGIPCVAVQHHHAHVASCIAEHGIGDPVLGIVFDGAGLGDDGTIWGGEGLVVDSEGYRRVGHLSCVPLPGGDAAAREPWRMAAAHLWSVFGGEPASWPVDPLPDASTRSLLLPMLERGLHSPDTSSVGRLFDAVAALLGVRARNGYEGQAAMELETIADGRTGARYSFGFREADGSMVFDPGPVIEAIAMDVARGVAPSHIAGAFHRALADAAVHLADRCRETDGVEIVALTGGVFQNRLLTEMCLEGLGAEKLRVLIHRRVPPNDGGLSLGQAVVASRSSGSDAAESHVSYPASKEVAPCA